MSCCKACTHVMLQSMYSCHAAKHVLMSCCKACHHVMLQSMSSCCKACCIPCTMLQSNIAFLKLKSNVACCKAVFMFLSLSQFPCQVQADILDLSNQKFNLMCGSAHMCTHTHKHLCFAALIGALQRPFVLCSTPVLCSTSWCFAAPVLCAAGKMYQRKSQTDHKVIANKKTLKDMKL